MRACGVDLTESDLDWLHERSEAADRPSFSQLARDFCVRKDLVDRRGRLREVAARVALNRLELKGLVSLPGRQAAVPRRALSGPLQPPQELYQGSAEYCGDLSEIEIVPVTRHQKVEHQQWLELMESSHYLGAGKLCGEQIRYLVRCSEGLLGALSFSASAWRLAERDRWIGWSESARDRNRHLLVGNSRFLLVPRIRNLASHVLSQSLARLPADWLDRYGHEPLLVETFVDPERFDGACYRAAGWTHVGRTTGRGRQDGHRDAKRQPKEIYVFALDPAARERLCVEPICEPDEEADWAEIEFGAADLPDERLKKRLCSIGRDFFARPTANIPQACGSRAKTKAVYRFCEHSKVTMESILQPHFEASLSRAAKEDVVLAIQDTTFINYCTHCATEGLGPIGSFGAQATLGLVAHCTLLLNSSGTPLGLLDAQCWARDKDSTSKAKQRRSLPIEEKESNKWLKSYAATTKAQRRLEKTKLVSVGDREADIYELFLEARKSEDAPGLLVRAVHARKLKLSDKGKGDKDCDAPSTVWKHVSALDCMGTIPLSVPRSGSRPRRETALELRFAEVTLAAPHGQRKPPVTMWAISAREATPPEKGPPIEWLLLTNLAVTNLDEAVEKIAWYTQRWQIEVYFRTLKSGCRIENRQLASADCLKTCIAVDLVVAWRIYHLVKLGREVPDVPCTAFFEEYEWKALTCFVNQSPTPAEKPPTLREAIHMTAGLGGFLGRKGDGNPGTQTLWRGLQRLDDISSTYQFITQARAPPAPDT